MILSFCLSDVIYGKNGDSMDIITFSIFCCFYCRELCLLFGYKYFSNTQTKGRGMCEHKMPPEKGIETIRVLRPNINLSLGCWCVCEIPLSFFFFGKLSQIIIQILLYMSIYITHIGCYTLLCFITRSKMGGMEGGHWDIIQVNGLA